MEFFLAIGKAAASVLGGLFGAGIGIMQIDKTVKKRKEEQEKLALASGENEEVEETEE